MFFKHANIRNNISLKKTYLHEQKNIRMPTNFVISVSDYKITTTDYIITDADYRIGRHLKKNYSGQKRFFFP